MLLKSRQSRRMQATICHNMPQFGCLLNDVSVRSRQQRTLLLQTIESLRRMDLLAAVLQAGQEIHRPWWSPVATSGSKYLLQKALKSTKRHSAPSPPSKQMGLPFCSWVPARPKGTCGAPLEGKKPQDAARSVPSWMGSLRIPPTEAATTSAASILHRCWCALWTLPRASRPDTDMCSAATRCDWADVHRGARYIPLNCHLLILLLHTHTHTFLGLQRARLILFDEVIVLLLPRSRLHLC